MSMVRGVHRVRVRLLTLVAPFLLLAVAAQGAGPPSFQDIASVTEEYEAALAADPALTAFVSGSVDPREAARLDDLSAALEALRENLRIPGMSAAVISDQTLVWAKGFGHANLEAGVPATPGTPYSLASLTKPFGAALLFRLIERGEVSLDDLATDYGIDYASPGTIRLRHLMSHTSEYFPGSVYRYNGDRYGSLDRVLWTKTGRTFTELFRSEIAEPLGFSDAATNPIDAGMVEAFLGFREARGEPRAILGPDGEPYALGEVSLDDPHIATTAGSFETLVASVADTTVFNLRLLPFLPVEEGTIESFRAFWRERVPENDVWARLARPYTVNQEMQPVRGRYASTTSVAAGILCSVVDLARFDAAINRDLLYGRNLKDLAMTPTVSTDGETLPYGLGWFVDEYAGKKLVWHYGYWNCASTLIVKVPEDQLTFVLLANSAALSSTFGIGRDENVLVSPAAALFLRHLVFEGGEAVSLDWSAPLGAIAAALAGVQDPAVRGLLTHEIRGAIFASAVGLLTSHTAAEFAGTVLEAWPEPRLPAVDAPVLAAIEDVGSGEFRDARFTLGSPRRVRVHAVGEGDRVVVYDYAWIEDAGTGERVWFMKPLEAEDAGGDPKNRMVDVSIVLPAGEYVLRYWSDGSHAFGDWNAVPPPSGFWGAVVWDEGPGEPQARETTWERAVDVSELGWSAAGLDSLDAVLGAGKAAAFMVVTGGKVVYDFGDVSYPFKCHSVRKSLLSGLYGPYIAEGTLSREATLADLGIDENPPLIEIEKSARLVDLLKARSGVYIPAMGETPEMAAARPERGSHEPGTHFYYNNWDFNVLGVIFVRETGEEIGEAFARRIADPIGMEDFDPAHVTYSYQRARTVYPRYAFRMSARDLARYGQLFLQKGEWNGRTVVPASWVEESTTTYSQDDRFEGMGYGYMWWTFTPDALGVDWPGPVYFAEGYGGHIMIVMPSIDTVVVHRANTEGRHEDHVGYEAYLKVLRALLRARIE